MELRNIFATRLTESALRCEHHDVIMYDASSTPINGLEREADLPLGLSQCTHVGAERDAKLVEEASAP